jgi:hypothetical protein
VTAAAYEHTAAHESAHAAAAAMLGVLPVGVQVGGLPDAAAGRVWFRSVDMNHALARRYAQIMLAGWIGSDESPPRWPLDAQAPKGSDEAKLVKLSSYLDLDQTSYAALVSATRELATHSEFVLLEHAFKTALSYRHVLDAHMVSTVLRAAMEPERVAQLYGGKENRRMSDPQRKSIPADFEPSSDGLVAIVGRDGQPQLVLADTPMFWWEKDEGKAFGAGGMRRNGNSDDPIRIKSFEV